MRKCLGVFFAASVGLAGAQAAVAPDANSMAECRLEYKVALGELKKLKVIKPNQVFRLSSTTEYDASKLRPFGLKATRFLLEYYGDDEGESDTLETNFALPFDKAKPKLLKAFGIKQCGGNTATSTQVCQLLYKNNDGGKYLRVAELRPLKTGGSRFLCEYVA